MPLQTATSTDSERDSLRALIEQRTMEWEQQNGRIKTTDIVRKELSADYWEKSGARKTPDESQPATAAAGNIEKAKRETISHPNVTRANERMQEVGKLLGTGELVKDIAKKLSIPERSIRYYRQRLAEINKDADDIEKTINRIAAKVSSTKDIINAEP